jgi:hypothetical protein
MKRAALLAFVLLAVTVTGSASSQSGTALAANHAVDSAFVQRSTSAASEKTVVVDCSYQQQTRPSWFILTCADAGDVLADMQWVSWGSTAAFATGVEQINDCTPDCVAGKFIKYPVLVDLWRPEPLPGHPGARYFSRVTRVYTANRPPLYYCQGKITCYPLTSTFDLWS